MNDNENVFEESEFVKIVPTDEDFDSSLEGRNGPMYQVRFCKTDVKVLIDTRIVAEIDYKDFDPGFNRSDYKAVMLMMKDIKEMPLEKWIEKYKVVNR